MPGADSQAILQFLRRCYEENGSRGGLWNFFGNSVTKRIFIEDQPDLLVEVREGIETHFLRAKNVRETADHAEIYRKERDLIYATVFVTGWVERFESKPEPVCAPLFFYPARLEIDPGMEHGGNLTIDVANRRLNAAVVAAIGGEEFLRKIEDGTENHALTEGCVGTVRREFAENFPASDVETLLTYPTLRGESELREAFRAVKSDPNAPLKLLPVGAVALVNKSTEMRGVLNELEEMAGPGGELSPPVRALLDGRASGAQKVSRGRIPAHLSAAQEKIIDSACEHPLTLAVGPPGTGKSFTIAALAIGALSRGGSVIIASKMDHAVNVAGDKIESAIGLENAVIRGGRKEYWRKLKSFLEDLLGGVFSDDKRTWKEICKLNSKLDSLEKKIRKLEKRTLKRISNEKKWGTVLSQEAENWWQKWRRNAVLKRVSAIPPVRNPVGVLYQSTSRQVDDTLEFLQKSRTFYLSDRLSKHRPSFQAFSRAIRARTGTKQEEYFSSVDWAHVLAALPVWLVNLSDVHKILPLAEHFDLAIIDEATQCDIASALPVLQRANRAVITGDPKQLRHLSFLPILRQAELGQEFGLDAEQRERFNFRNVSLLDLASEQIHDQDRVAFLNEHFRSRPEIIEFSNREFYAGQLHVMTGRHAEDSVVKAKSPLRVTQVEGASRSEAGTNKAEADAIFAELIEVCEKQNSTGEPLSIGILSPFRNQVDFLRHRLADSHLANTLLHRHSLLIGTAHTFQGEERDLVFISLAIDNCSPSASFRFLEKPDVFNVAVTRARQLNHVFHSFDKARLAPDSLVGKYLSWAHEVDIGGHRVESPAAAPGQHEHDEFANEVAEFLRGIGAEVHIGYPLAGTVVDIVYTVDGVSRGIDLVGYPGAFEDAFPLERVLTFQRADLQIYPLAYSEWHFRRKDCETWIRDLHLDEEKEVAGKKPEKIPTNSAE
ncbi:MAG: ATP-binding protein [Verrucomicrobiales bacterium]|nr:ATP-binding protein [Verrucomicrobiales bacterium]